MYGFEQVLDGSLYYYLKLFFCHLFYYDFVFYAPCIIYYLYFHPWINFFFQFSPHPPKPVQMTYVTPRGSAPFSFLAQKKTTWEQWTSFWDKNTTLLVHVQCVPSWWCHKTCVMMSFSVYLRERIRWRCLASWVRLCPVNIHTHNTEGGGAWAEQVRNFS